jgi:AICAR transformylase/IMP cyclohydrolase PurH
VVGAAGVGRTHQREAGSGQQTAARLRGEEVSFPNTTDVDELVDWVRPFDEVTVLATYASSGWARWSGRTGPAFQGGT